MESSRRQTLAISSQGSGVPKQGTGKDRRRLRQPIPIPIPIPFPIPDSFQGGRQLVETADDEVDGARGHDAGLEGTLRRALAASAGLQFDPDGVAGDDE